MNWTQPLCSQCYEKLEPGRIPHRIKPECAELERCCMCDLPTAEGIYYRINPERVPYPKQEE